METNFKVDVPSFALGFNTGKNKGGSGGGVIEPITIKENGTYNATDGVDGYAPITVDVAGSGGGGDNTVIDVESLPTENVDDSKIYRIVTSGSAKFYLADGSVMAVEELFKLLGVNMNIEGYLVDVLPDKMKPMDFATYDLPVYVLKSTGVGYVSTDGTTASAVTLGTVLTMGSTQTVDGGWVDSADDIVVTDTPTVYTVAGGSTITYGLPNGAENKVFYEYGNNKTWAKCESGSRLMLYAYELPTENIDTERVYLMERNITQPSVELYVATKDGRTGRFADIFLEDANAHGANWSHYDAYYYLVDELPDANSANMSLVETAVHIYIVRGTGQPYVAEQSGMKRVWIEFMSDNDGSVVDYTEYKGIIQYPEEAVEAGHYTVITEAGTKITYGVPNPENNKDVCVLYDGEWVNVSAMKARCDALEKVLDSLRG